VILSDGDRPVVDSVRVGHAGPDPPVEVVSEDSDRVHLAVERDSPGYLVLGRTHFPGWKATVNGRPAPVLRANFAFCAIELDAGKSEIDFHYAPDSFRNGLAISVACPVLGALLALAAWLWKRRRTEAIPSAAALAAVA
jgi:uncharacterized membrane protein YfhO